MAFTYYISTLGSFSGLNPALNESVGIERGSYLRSELQPVPQNGILQYPSNIVVGSYGQGALPVISAFDIIPASWIKTDGYNSVWEFHLSIIPITDSYQRIEILYSENNSLLYRIATSLSDLDSNGGYMFSPSTNLKGVSSVVLYIKAINPNTDGVVREFTNRGAGIDIRYGTGNSISNIFLRGARVEYGAIYFGLNAYMLGIIATDCSEHNIAFGSGTIEKSIAWGNKGRTLTATTYFVAYTPTAGAGILDVTLRDCLAYRTDNISSRDAGVINHTGGNTPQNCHGNVSLYGFQTVGAYRFASSNSCLNYLIANDEISGRKTYAKDCKFFCNITAFNSFTADGFIINSVNNFQAGFQITTCPNIVIKNGVAAIDGGTGYQGFITDYDGTAKAYTISNVTFASKNEGATFATHPFISSNTNGSSFDVRNCIIRGCKARYIDINSTGTFTGDYNIYIGSFQKWRINKIDYNSLAAWRAATGADTNSIYLTEAQAANLFVGDFWAGDFRVRDDSGLTFVDGTPVNSSGAQTDFIAFPVILDLMGEYNKRI